MSDISRALSALNSLDPSCNRDGWVKAGMAAKAAGLSFDDFHGWSKDGANYRGEKDCLIVWNSIDEFGGITAATLFSMAKVNGGQCLNKPVENQNIAIGSCQKSVVDNKQAPEFNPHALEIWERCLPAPETHGYILSKNGLSDGLRHYPTTEPPLIINRVNVAGYLVVPCWSGDELQTLQFIPPVKGEKKLNLSGASFNDGYFVLGTVTDRIYLCEGIGQAWAVNRVTGGASVVCFGSGRMMRVAKVMRRKFPHVQLIVVPDCGQEVLAVQISQSISASWVELPHDIATKNYDVNDYALEHGDDALARVLADIKRTEENYELLSVEQLYNTQPMRWIVKGIIPKEGLTALYGASGSGKSFLLLDLALTIATGGTMWFGRRVTAIPITYVCLEGESGLNNRVKAWFKYTNKPLPHMLRFLTKPFNLLTEDVKKLADVIIAAGHQNGMIIIDTLNRAATGADENSSSDMGKIISACGELQRLAGGVVMLVHHMGKDVSKKMRGHSSLPAALDGAIEVTRTESNRQWSVAKSKDDKDGDVFPFKLEVINLGVDEDGDAITSCVVDYDSSNASKRLCRVIAPKAGNRKIIYDGMNELLAASKEYGKAGAAPGKPCIEIERVVRELYGRLPCEHKRQNERIRLAITGLIASGIFTLRDGWLWAV